MQIQDLDHLFQGRLKTCWKTAMMLSVFFIYLFISNNLINFCMIEKKWKMKSFKHLLIWLWVWILYIRLCLLFLWQGNLEQMHWEASLQTKTTIIWNNNNKGKLRKCVCMSAETEFSTWQSSAGWHSWRETIKQLVVASKSPVSLTTSFFFF